MFLLGTGGMTQVQGNEKFYIYMPIIVKAKAHLESPPPTIYKVLNVPLSVFDLCNSLSPCKDEFEELYNFA
jgi:hypothetical protein